MTEGGIEDDKEQIKRLSQLLDEARQVMKEQGIKLQRQEAKLNEVTAALESLRVDFSNALSKNNSGVPVFKTKYLDVVPVFSGDSETLNSFLDITGKLYDHFYNAADPDDFQNFMLLAGIKSKIHPPASTAIYSSDQTTYAQLRDALINVYSDKRDLHDLVIEMSNLEQSEEESPFIFHAKVSGALKKIIAYILTHDTPDAPVLVKHMEGVALQCFLSELREPLRSMLLAHEPSDLDMALCFMTEDYQFLPSSDSPTQSEPNWNALQKRPQNALTNYKSCPSRNNFSKPQNSKYQSNSFKNSKPNQSINQNLRGGPSQNKNSPIHLGKTPQQNHKRNQKQVVDDCPADHADPSAQNLSEPFSGIRSQPISDHYVSFYIEGDQSLPFITLPRFNLKILVSTGSTLSCINPHVARKYFSAEIEEDPDVRTVHGTTLVTSFVRIPCGKLFRRKGLQIKFYVCPFNPKYDLLLGAPELMELGLRTIPLDYLETSTVRIPFKFFGSKSKNTTQ